MRQLPFITFSHDADMDTVLSVLHDWFVTVVFREGCGTPDVSGIVNWSDGVLSIMTEGGQVAWSAEDDAVFDRIALFEVA